jgi:hypothetical protein
MIKDVYFISEMKSNVLNIGQLMKKEYKIFSNKRSLNIEDKTDIIVASVEMMSNKMFKLNLNSIQERCLKVDLKNKNELWYLKFGHVNYVGLKRGWESNNDRITEFWVREIVLKRGWCVICRIEEGMCYWEACKRIVQEN